MIFRILISVESANFQLNFVFFLRFLSSLLSYTDFFKSFEVNETFVAQKRLLDHTSI